MAEVHSNARTNGAKEVATHYAADFSAAARLQKLEMERSNLSAELQELAALRLQRWYRAVCWRVAILPQQLLKMRILLYSCIAIQRVWRSSLLRTKPRRSEEHVAALQAQLCPSTIRHKLSPKPDDGHIAPAILELGDEGIEPPSKFIEGADGTLQYLGVSCQSLSPREAVVPEIQAFSPVAVGSLSYAAAVWKGYKVRRALGSRVLQGKVQLRHDLYLLISDVEGRGKLSREEPMPQRLAPWVDVLYSGLGRLQGEVLSELHALLRGNTQLWGSPRCPLVWRGWSRDLLRLPRLMLDLRVTSAAKREFSPSMCSEPSLLACTAYQAITPPGSPQQERRPSVASLESRPRVHAPVTVQYEEWLLAGNSEPDPTHTSHGPWGCEVTTPPTASQVELVASSGCSPADTALTTPTPPHSSSPSGTPRGFRNNSKLPPPPDWTNVRPRVRCWASPAKSARLSPSARSTRQLGAHTPNAAGAVRQAIRSGLHMDASGISTTSHFSVVGHRGESQPSPAQSSLHVSELQFEERAERLHAAVCGMDGLSVPLPVAGYPHERVESFPRWSRRKGAAGGTKQGSSDFKEDCAWAWPSDISAWPDSLTIPLDAATSADEEGSSLFSRVRPGDLGSDPEQ